MAFELKLMHQSYVSLEVYLNIQYQMMRCHQNQEVNETNQREKIKPTADNVQVTNHKMIQLECGKEDNEP